MITGLEIAPNVVGYRVDGKISKDDVQRVFDDIEELVGAKSRIRAYAEVHSMTGMSLNALWSDIRLAVQRWGDVKRIEKVAVVTDIDWIRKAAGVEDRVFRGIDIRVFEPDDQAQARRWVQT